MHQEIREISNECTLALFDIILRAFADPEKKLSVRENENLGLFLQTFYASGGNKETCIKLDKENDLFFRNHKLNKFLIGAKKKFLEELSLIKKEIERDVENNSIGNPKHIEILSIISEKSKIFLSTSSAYSEDPILTNILASKNLEYSQEPEIALFEKDVVEGFREKIDIESAKKLFSIYEMEAQNEIAREKTKLGNLDAKAEKIRSSKKYADIDSYELALLVLPPTLNIPDFISTKDLNSLSGKIYELTAVQCLQSLGAGKAIMKLSYSDTPIFAFLHQIGKLLKSYKTAYKQSAFTLLNYEKRF